MTPATVHYLAQLIRHARAMLTETEKWLMKQAPQDEPPARE